jgi:hypothetical protein
MTPQELEDQLRQLGADWPIPSVADAVMARIESRVVPPPRRVSVLRRRATLLIATAALLVVALGAAWLFLLAAPTTLQAQVQQALAKARTAHIVISALDDKGVRQQGDIWYERGRGFRAEMPDEVILDDGRQQWTWRPGTRESELVIARRASRDAVSMITDLFQFGNVPAAWAQQRAPEHDRAIDGRPCHGFVVTPPTPQVVKPDSSDLVPDPHPPRFVVLIDPDERIVYLEEQRQVDGRWQAGREVSLAYDVKVPAEKLAVNLPAGGRVIDADRALEERFPLDKALAREEADGLLFAVHELQRGPDEMFYVVSSVRGTPEFLKQHPPQRRRLNLQVTLLDVAEQSAAASTDLECNRAVLGSAEADGVHYLWWLAVRRHYFKEEQGKRTPQFDSPSLEVNPGTVRVPLQAIHRNSPGVAEWVRVNVDTSIAADQQVQPLADLAARARRDALLIQQAPGAIVYLLGWAQDGETRHTKPMPDQITDKDFARQVSQQLEWLHSLDKITEPDQGMMPPGMPGAPTGR